MIIHLNGMPGAGKLTIARIIADKMGARLIDNHTLHNVAFACVGRDSDARWPLYDIVQGAAYDALADRPRDEIFVMTNALAHGYDRDQMAWDKVVELAARRDVPLVPVILRIDLDENIKRVGTDERRHNRKLTDPAVLKDYHETLDLLAPTDNPNLLELDVTRLSPEEAAEAILKHIDQI